MLAMERGAGDRRLAAFLEGAGVVCDALGSSSVAARWDAPSVLDGQSVGGLAGHLARGGVWVVGDYLAGPEPEAEPLFQSAAEYELVAVQHLDAAAHQAIRDRGAEVAAAGPAEVAATARTRLAEVAPLLPRLGPDRKVAVIGGAVMRLGDYLSTRVVEQAVHLDDLARSVEGATWQVPATCLQLAIDVGIELASLRYDATEVLRALYRGEAAAPVFPVM